MRNIAFKISLVFIFLIPWEGVQLPGLGTITRLFGFVMAGFWLATVVITKQLRKPGPFHIMVCIFVLWAALSIFWSENPNRTLGHVKTWLQLLMFVFVLWDLYTTKTAIFAGLQAFILGEYIGVGMTIYNYFTGNAYYTHYQRFSPSPTTNPDGFGIMVALGISIAWYIASSESTTKWGRILKFINYAYIPVAFIGITLSGTRTAMIASIPAIAFGLASLTRLRLAARIVIFLLLTWAVLILLPRFQELRSFQRFSTTVPELTQGDLNGRTEKWSDGLDSFIEHPLLGVGSNMYRSVTRQGNVAHNAFISVLVELGLIGFMLFGLILTIAFIQAWKQPKWESSFWITLLITWVIAVSSLSYEDRRATWLFLGMIVASAALTRQREKQIYRTTRSINLIGLKERDSQRNAVASVKLR